jgi:hypothetical protein
MKTEIYRNLHKKCFSVRQRGRVVGHLMDDPTEHVLLKDVKFAVQPAGRRKVLREKRKNVHAFVRGDMVSPHSIPYPELNEFKREVTYNPYHYSTFYFKESELGITDAAYALVRHGKVWVRETV